MNKKYKLLFKDTIIFALGSLGSKLILFFLVPLYTNYLTDAEYGIADLVFTTSQLIIPIVSIVIYEAIIRFGLAKGKNKAEVLKVGFVVGNIGAIITVLATPLFTFYRPLSQWKWYLCVYVILNFNANIFKSYLKVKNRNKRYAIICICQTVAMALLNILFLVVLHTSVSGYLLASIGAAGLALILSIFAGDAIRDLRRAKFDKALCREMIGYSAPLILNDLSWWVIHSSDKYMVEAMIDASALGLYTVATKIPSLINVLISIFGQAWGISSIREIETTNDLGFYSKVFKYYLFITSGACIFLVSIIKPFMTIYVSSKFRPAWVFVPLLLVSAVFSSISSYYGQLYGALKKSINNMLTTLFAALLNIVVNFVCIIQFGVWGAIIGTVTAYICLAIARMWDVGRFLSIKLDYPLLLSNCIIIIAQGVMVSMDFHIIPVSAVCILLFAIINYKTAHEMITSLRKKA